MKVIAVGVTDGAHFEQRVELDGVTYALTFHWNARRSLWSIDIGLPGEAPALAGVTVVSNRYLLTRAHHLVTIPPGELIAIDPTLEITGPPFDWSGFFLAYVTPEEARAGAAT